MCIQRETVRQTLLWLENRYRAWVRNPFGAAGHFHERLCVAYSPFAETELGHMLTGAELFDCSAQRRYLFLEPADGGAILPVLSFRYDFQRAEPELRLQVALFVPCDNGFAGIGCRFETSEGRGAHDYCHAQFFREFHGQTPSAPLRFCPPWLPTSQPAFLLKADGPVDLMLCMIVSLYGSGRARDLQNEPFSNELRPHMQRLFPAEPVSDTHPAARNRRRSRRRGR